MKKQSLTLRIALIIDPDAWKDFDNLSPTAREIWDRVAKKRRIIAKKKARIIMRKTLRHYEGY